MHFRNEDEHVEVVCSHGHWSAMTVHNARQDAPHDCHACGAALPIRFPVDLDQKFRQADKDEGVACREKRSGEGGTA